MRSELMSEEWNTPSTPIFHPSVRTILHSGLSEGMKWWMGCEWKSEAVSGWNDGVEEWNVEERNEGWVGEWTFERGTSRRIDKWVKIVDVCSHKRKKFTLIIKGFNLLMSQWIWETLSELSGVCLKGCMIKWVNEWMNWLNSLIN